MFARRSRCRVLIRSSTFGRWCRGGTVVITGSEDGDLVLLQLRAVEPSRRWAMSAMSAVVMARGRYSATAQRGINALALRGDRLAVASCAVGQQQGNLHLLRVHPSRFEPLDEARLQGDPGRAQVFAFSTLWAELKNRPLFVGEYAGRAAVAADARRRQAAARGAGARRQQCRNRASL
jgi:hypothetical protein